MSINQSMNQFPEHIPGQPYELTPIQFFNFLGLGHSFRNTQNQQDCNSITPNRLLNILPKYKRVRVMTESQPWWYHKTESGTIFYIEVIDGEIKFFVTIPENRDKKRRRHYTKLRIGVPYNGDYAQK